jgi:hypothetical protein
MTDKISENSMEALPGGHRANALDALGEKSILSSLRRQNH